MTATNADRSSRKSWAEITSFRHKDDSDRFWTLGHTLFCPTHNKRNAPMNHTLTLVSPGDEVFHFVKGVPNQGPNRRFLFGRSIVATRPDTRSMSNRRCYLVKLTDFLSIQPLIDTDQMISELLDIIAQDLQARTEHYAFIKYGDGIRFSQGNYLATLSPELADAIRDYFRRPR